MKIHISMEGAAMFSKSAEYGVRACLCLASRPGEAQTVHRIANEIHIPSGYLAKVLQLLGRAGIVRAQPGPGGGFLLIRNPAEICVLEVIETLSPLPRIRECPAGVDERELTHCPLHARIDEALEAVERSLRGCTLADLLSASAQRVSHEGSEP